LSGVNAVTNTSFVNQSFTLFATNNLELSGPMILSNLVNITSLGTSSVKFSGPISGDFGFNKLGTNVLVLSGANTYAGATALGGGTLLVNNISGSGTGTNTVTVNTDSILGGTGTIAGPVAITGGSVGAGSSGAGVLTLGNGLDLSGGTDLWELAANKDSSNGLAGVDFDVISLTAGDLVLGPSSVLSLGFIGTTTTPRFSNPFWQSNHAWKIISLSGTASNSGTSNFGSIAGTNGFASGNFSTSVDGGGNIILNYVAGPVPPAPVVDRNLGGAGTTNVTISFSAVNGVTYEVQYKNNLTDPNWTVLGAVTATGSTASIVDNTDPAPTRRFYRVVIQ
jgi:autotransporter-associated beta strand protein